MTKIKFGSYKFLFGLDELEISEPGAEGVHEREDIGGHE